MTFPVSYEPITLDRMTDSKLMDRVDTKYVTTTIVLQELLARAAPFYYVLVTGNKELASYRTLYFDTDDRAMYIMHQNGHLNRVIELFQIVFCLRNIINIPSIQARHPPHYQSFPA